MASYEAPGLKTHIMSFRTQPYGSYQGTAEARHRQCNCRGPLRGQKHLTTKPHGSSASPVEAPMPQNAELVTRPYGERGCRRRKRARLCVESMHILPLL